LADPTPQPRYERRTRAGPATGPAPRSFLGAGARLDHVVDLLHDLGVRQGRDVAEGPSPGHVAEQPAHDLSRTGLGEVVREDEGVGPGDLADLLRHMLPELGRHALVALVARLQRDERHDGL